MSDSLKPSRRLDPEFRLRLTPEAVRAWMSLYAASIQESEHRLTQLDAFIGDGDHGANMHRGMEAVVRALGQLPAAPLSGQFRAISTALTSSVGGAAGPLYGAFFLHAAQATANKNELAAADLAAVVEAGCRGVVQLGKAAVGDKTMVDTLSAGVASLRASATRHEPLRAACDTCRDTAHQAAVATTPMVARRGRASYLGERSAGFQDPGATSAALLFASLAEAVSALPAPPPLTSTIRQPTLASP